MIFSILISICFALCIAQQEQLPLLPGIKELELGFDGVKMREQLSKFPIFDLSDRNGAPFIVKALGQQRSYAVPDMVQATDISVRREIYCESIAYSFEQFYRR